MRWKVPSGASGARTPFGRSEEHTSELQSQSNLVCRLLLEKKKKHTRRSLLAQSRRPPPHLPADCPPPPSAQPQLRRHRDAVFHLACFVSCPLRPRLRLDFC